MWLNPIGKSLSFVTSWHELPWMITTVSCPWYNYMGFMTEWVKFSVSHSFLCLPTAPRIGLALPPSINQHYPSAADSWRWEASQNPEVGLSTSWNALERHSIQIPQLPAKKSIYPCCARNCYGDITYVRRDRNAIVRLWFSNRFHVLKAVKEMGKRACVCVCVHFWVSLWGRKNYEW